MDALPTREEIAEILKPDLLIADKHQHGWACKVCVLAQADALLARLRRAWERTEKEHGPTQDQESGPGVPSLRSGSESSGADSLVVPPVRGGFDWVVCRQRITDTILDRYDPSGVYRVVDEILSHVQRLVQSLQDEHDALRADLRACAEALVLARRNLLAWTMICTKTFVVPEAEMEALYAESPEIKAIDAALARPGVREAMKR